MSRGNTDEFLTLVAVVNLLVIFSFATVLLLSLPQRVKVSLQRTKRMFDCWVGLLVVVGLAALPTNVVICFVHFELIPWPLAAQALKAATVAVDADDLRDEIGEVRAEHRAEIIAQGGTRESAEEIQRMLWDSWPLIVLTCIGLAVLSVWMLGKFYTQLVLYLLKDATLRV